jgi:hypothetical protein
MTFATLSARSGHDDERKRLPSRLAKKAATTFRAVWKLKGGGSGIGDTPRNSDGRV